MEREVLYRDKIELGIMVADQVTAMLAYWDKDLICRFANKIYLHWFGTTREKMIDQMHISELLGEELYQKNLPYIQGALNGEKQEFERELPIKGTDEIRSVLANYIPDFCDGKVIGFFVHVADVTLVKELEKKAAQSKREILKHIIETEETGRRYLFNILRENVNQRLAACRMMIEQKKENSDQSLKDVNLYISEIINELNEICEELTPSEVEIFGLLQAIEIHIEKFTKHSNQIINFNHSNPTIEKMDDNNKLFIFRIIQNYLKLVINANNNISIDIDLNFQYPNISIKMCNNGALPLNKRSQEYNAIECRCEYYAGKLTETLEGNKQVLLVEYAI